MKRFALAASVAAFGLVGGTAAYADDPAPSSGHGAFQQACGADLQTYCSAAKSRDERHACVDANKDKFSDGCKSFMAQHPRHGSGAGQPPQGN